MDKNTIKILPVPVKMVVDGKGITQPSFFLSSRTDNLQLRQKIARRIIDQEVINPHNFSTLKQRRQIQLKGKDKTKKPASIEILKEPVFIQQTQKQQRNQNHNQSVESLLVVDGSESPVGRRSTNTSEQKLIHSIPTAIFCKTSVLTKLRSKTPQLIDQHAQLKVLSSPRNTPPLPINQVNISFQQSHLPRSRIHYRPLTQPFGQRSSTPVYQTIQNRQRCLKPFSFIDNFEEKQKSAWEKIAPICKAIIQPTLLNDGSEVYKTFGDQISDLKKKMETKEKLMVPEVFVNNQDECPTFRCIQVYSQEEQNQERQLEPRMRKKIIESRRLTQVYERQLKWIQNHYNRENSLINQLTRRPLGTRTAKFFSL